MYFLGLIAQQRELFQMGRNLDAQNGDLSPLVVDNAFYLILNAFYLILTVPLTHLVHYIYA